MATRSSTLELAILGVLTEDPLHGYELRKRLVSVLGLFTTISFGALYPTLRSLVSRGLLAEVDTTQSQVYPKKNRIVYQVTDLGKAHLQELVADQGATSWDDDVISVRIALFGQTSAATRLHILRGRRARLEDRLQQMRANVSKGRERLDAYTLELQQHGLDSLEREVAWLGEMISKEESGGFSATTNLPPQGTLKPRPTEGGLSEK